MVECYSGYELKVHYSGCITDGLNNALLAKYKKNGCLTFESIT